MQAALGSVTGPNKELRDLAGRVALVVGGSKGIGIEVARGLLQAQISKVILLSADPNNGPGAAEKFKHEFGPDVNIEWYQCDVGSLKNIKEVVLKIARTEDRLDFLILSAGINALPFDLDADGIDRHFGCNWLGQFYIINLLYPLIRKTSKIPNTPAPRIVMEASQAYLAAPSSTKFASIDEINDDKLGPTQLYARSKLATILGIRYGIYERVIKPNEDNVIAVTVHPGTVKTDMQQHWKEAYPGLLGWILTNLMLAIGRSPKQGSCSALYAVTSQEIEEKGWNGAYFSDVGKKGSETGQAKDPELGKNLWELSERLIKDKAGLDALENWSRIISV